jgi:hypothetical protein
VSDMRGNESESVQQFTIANDVSSANGCPPQVPSSAP